MREVFGRYDRTDDVLTVHALDMREQLMMYIINKGLPLERNPVAIGEQSSSNASSVQWESGKRGRFEPEDYGSS